MVSVKTTRSRRASPPPPPKVVPPKPSTFTPPPRDWLAAVEWIPTACERLIERRANRSESTFSLWEPVLDGASYGTTQTIQNKLWGLAHTRRSSTPLVDRAAIDWEISQQQRAVHKLAESLLELAGAMPEGVYRGCGTILLSGYPQRRAEVAAAAARAAALAAGYREPP